MKISQDINIRDKKRNPNVELFRILLMFMIVGQHSIVHGLGLARLGEGLRPASNCNVEEFILYAFMIVAVNCFFWISGYFGIKLDLNKIVSLFLECVFYSVIINVILLLAEEGDASIVLTLLKRELYVLNFYWFMAAYLALCFLSPALNAMLAAMGKTEKRYLVVVFFAINTIYSFLFNGNVIGSGYTLFQGIYIYVVGAVCRGEMSVLEKKIDNKKLCLLYAGLSILVGISSYLLCAAGKYDKAWRLFSFYNPLIVFSAIALCLLFVRNRKVPNLFFRYISKLGICALAVYLISDYPEVRKYIFIPMNDVIRMFGNTRIAVLIAVFINAVIITAFCLLVEKIRQTTINLVRENFRKWRNRDGNT